MTLATWIEAAVAVATGLLAGATWWMARKTSTAAAATELDAKASQRAAEATEKSAAAAQASLVEIQRGRELEWQPYLSVEVPTTTRSPDPDRLAFVASVRNLGRGPALTCICGLRSGDLVALSGVFDLATQAQTEVVGDSTNYGNPNLRAMFLAKHENTVLQRAMAVCRDGLTGHWYRFIQGTVAPDTWDLVEPAPDWVQLIGIAFPELRLGPSFGRGTYPLSVPSAAPPRPSI